MTDGPKFIVFKDVAPQLGAKTKRWVVSTKQGGELGRVQWFTNWRRYCFFPLPGTTYDANCLRDIADFCEQKTREHVPPKSIEEAALEEAAKTT